MSLDGFGYVIGTLILCGALSLIMGLMLPADSMVVTGIVALALAAFSFPAAVWKLRGTLRGIESDFERQRRKHADEAEEKKD